MSDAWEEIQAVKSKRNSLREKLEKRKKERQNILGASLGTELKSEGSPASAKAEQAVASPDAENKYLSSGNADLASLEKRLLQALVAAAGTGESASGESLGGAKDLLPNLTTAELSPVNSLLQKFATQKLITVRSQAKESGRSEHLEVSSVDHMKLIAMVNELLGTEDQKISSEKDGPDGTRSEVGIVARKRKGEDKEEQTTTLKSSKTLSDEKKVTKAKDTDIMVSALWSVKDVGQIPRTPEQDTVRTPSLAAVPIITSHEAINGEPAAATLSTPARPRPVGKIKRKRPTQYGTIYEETLAKIKWEEHLLNKRHAEERHAWDLARHLQEMDHREKEHKRRMNESEKK